MGAAGVHLTDQDYSICIRPDRTACAICYYVDAQTDWGVGVPNGIAGIGVKGVDTNCGAPGIALFAKGGGNDLVQIPGGQCDSPDGNGALCSVPQRSLLWNQLRMYDRCRWNIHCRN